MSFHSDIIRTQMSWKQGGMMRSLKKLLDGCMRELDALDIPYGSIHKIGHADLGKYLGNCIS